MLVQTQTLAELVRMQKGKQRGGANVNGEDKMPLFFLEIVYADKRADLWADSSPTSHVRTNQRGTEGGEHICSMSHFSIT
jgi:hypothetical protein